VPGRQILEILLPGDVFGLDLALIGRVAHPVRALTPCTVCVHDPQTFGDIFAERPDLVRSLMATLIRNSERIETRWTLIGQGSCPQRVAHLILETWNRLAQRGLAPMAAKERHGVWIPFPLQRRHLAAALGMSGTHVYRSLIELEAQKLIRVEDEAMVILKPTGLAVSCGFVPVSDEHGTRVVL